MAWSVETLVQDGMKAAVDVTVVLLSNIYNSLPHEQKIVLHTSYITYLTEREALQNREYETRLQTVKERFLQENRQALETNPDEYKQREVKVLYTYEQDLVQKEFEDGFSMIYHKANVFLKTTEGNYTPHRWFHMIRAVTASDERAWENIFFRKDDKQIFKVVLEEKTLQKILPFDLFARAAWKYLEGMQSRSPPLQKTYLFGRCYRSLILLWQVCRAVEKNAVGSPHSINSPRAIKRVAPLYSSTDVLATPRIELEACDLDEFERKIHAKDQKTKKDTGSNAFFEKVRHAAQYLGEFLDRERGIENRALLQRIKNIFDSIGKQEEKVS